MFEFTLSDLAAAIQPVRVHPDRAADRRCVGVSIDSRTIRPGELFIAIRGNRFDGHAFAGAAIAAGAGAVVSDRPPPDDLAPDRALWLEVADPVRALQRLAMLARHRHAATFVGVTGSNGKTTTRELTAGLLRRCAETFATAGNLNNHLGLPLNLLRLPSTTRFGVFELGMNHRGEIAVLADILRPHLGVVTNVGPAHLENLGSLENIARAKGELIEALPETGRAVLNGDDTFFRVLAGCARCPVLSFAIEREADLEARDIRLGPDGASFTVRWRGAAPHPVRLPLLGRHNVSNALAAMTVALHLGISLETAIETLATMMPVPARMEPVRTRSGVRLIHDCYNANPASMRAALEYLALCPGRRIAVLGDMFELGPTGEQLHFDIGRVAGTADLAALVVVGELAQAIAQGALAAGMPAARVHPCRDHAEAADWLSLNARSDDLVLVKASRGMHFEQIVSAVWPDVHQDLH